MKRFTGLILASALFLAVVPMSAQVMDRSTPMGWLAFEEDAQPGDPIRMRVLESTPENTRVRLDVPGAWVFVKTYGGQIFSWIEFPPIRLEGEGFPERDGQRAWYDFPRETGHPPLAESKYRNALEIGVAKPVFPEKAIGENPRTAEEMRALGIDPAGARPGIPTARGFLALSSRTTPEDLNIEIKTEGHRLKLVAPLLPAGYSGSDQELEIPDDFQLPDFQFPDFDPDFDFDFPEPGEDFDFPSDPGDWTIWWPEEFRFPFPWTGFPMTPTAPEVRDFGYIPPQLFDEAFYKEFREPYTSPEQGLSALSGLGLFAGAELRLPLLQVLDTYEIEIFTTMEVQVKHLKGPVDFDCPISWDHWIFKLPFINGEALREAITAKGLRIEASRSARYLILTPSEYRKELDEFAKWKNSKGLHVDFAYIGEGAGDDIAPEREAINGYLEKYFKEHYCHGVYVLLVGDRDTIPSGRSDRVTASPDANQADSDRVYAVLGDDLFPSMYVGRLSVASADQLQVQLNKILSYERSPALGNWPRRATLAANSENDDGSRGVSDSFPSKYAEAVIDIASYGNYSAPPVFEMLHAGAASEDDVRAVNADVIAAVNAGRGHLLYRGHGGDTTWEAGWDGSSANGTSFQSLTHIPQLENNAYPIVYSIACRNNRLRANSIGEAWMNHKSGAVAHWGASVNSFTVENHERAKGIFRAMHENGFTRLGPALAEAERISHSATGGAGGWNNNSFTYLLLGDPELTIRREAVTLFDIVPQITRTADGTSILLEAEKLGPISGAFINVRLHDDAPSRNGFTSLEGRLLLPEIDPSQIARLEIHAEGFQFFDFADDPPIPTVVGEHDFLIDGPDSVAFHLFNTLRPGTVEATIEWTGDSAELDVALTGRRRPDLENPTAPYVTTSGSSPLTLTYDVTGEDLSRGVGWRLVIRDGTGASDATGTITLSVPFDEQRQRAFQREKVSLRSGDIWPSETLHGQFLDRLREGPVQGLHTLISLTGAADCHQQWLLEQSGVIRQSFLPGRNSLGLVRRDADLNHPEVAQLIRAFTPLEPEDKIDPHILLGDYARFRVMANGETPANMVLNADGSLDLSVIFAPDATPEEIGRILDGEALFFEPITDRIWAATISPAALTRLAAHDVVEWIDAGPAPHLPDLNNSRATLNVDGLQQAVVTAGPPATITYNGLTGFGINVGVQDNGIDGAHPDLNLVAAIGTVAPRVHGTHVAGIIAASGVQSNQNDAAGNPNNGAAFQWRGVAPNAGLIDSRNLENAANLLSGIQNNSLALVNRSQSTGFDGNYSASDQAVDAHIRGGSTSGGVSVPRRPWVYSAGNHGFFPFNGGSQIGYFALTKQTKNSVVVGNWDATTGGLNPSSSMGPAHDGRIKPDIVAPGTAVLSTVTTGDGNCGTAVGANLANGYVPCTGTSMAAPAISGSLALLLEGWQITYNDPRGYTLAENPPLPSTLRALLIQTAQDIVNNNVRNAASADVDSDSDPSNGNDGQGFPTATVGPDYTTGWGLADAAAAVDLLLDSREAGGLPVPNRMIQDAVNQAGVRAYEFVVDIPQDIRVTLAWDDIEAAPANPATNPMLINDLDLELVAPDGTVHYPWRLGHWTEDLDGNPIPAEDHVPGMDYQVAVAIAPTANPALNNDYVPQDALVGNGDWVAAIGRDRLNNVEQVFVANAQPGRWTARVVGFNVTGAQDFSLVGFPYPDLPDLVAYANDHVGIPALGEEFSFTWTHANVGAASTGGSYDYQLYLADSFSLDNAVPLPDANQAQLGPLAAGGSSAHTSSVTITQAHLDALLGAGTTFDDFLAADPFLLIHVDASDAILEHNEANNLGFAQIARLVDVVLVMDRSGSMRGVVPVSAGNATKMDLMRNSIQLFLDLLRRNAGDRLGLVSFAGDITIDLDDDGQVLAYTTGTREEARDAVDALVASGTTNIRGALQEGLGMIPADDGSRRRVIVFLSDGKANQGGDASDDLFLGQFAAHNVRIFSVGYGTEGGTGFAALDIPLLETLAGAGDGFFHVTEHATGLHKFFVNAVAGATEAEVILDPVEDIDPGQTHTHAITVGGHDRTATFILTWDNPDADLELFVRDPAGRRIDAGNLGTFGGRVSLTAGDAYQLMTIRLPLPDLAGEQHAGSWRLGIHNPGGAAARYSASAVADSTLRASMALPQAPQPDGFMSGDPVNLDLAVSQRGSPLRHAKATMTANVPLVSLGDALSSGIVTQADLDRIPEHLDGDELDLDARMFMALWQILGTNPMPRADLPSAGLGLAGQEGEFNGLFGGTRIPGSYEFTVRIHGIDEDCSPFQREISQTVNIGFRPDPEISRIDVRTPGDGSYTVTVTPLDRFGSFFGPGRSSSIVFEAAGGTAVGPVEDNLNGSYSRTFRPETARTLVVTVSVLGVPLRPVAIDVDLPAPGLVIPGVGAGDTPIVISIPAIGGRIGSVTGIRLVGTRGAVALEEFWYDERNATFMAEVPAGLPPGLYHLAFDADGMPGAILPDATFRILGTAERQPVEIERLHDFAAGLVAGATALDRAEALAGIIRALRETAPGRIFLPAVQQEAVTEAARLLAHKGGDFSPADVLPILEAVNAATIDDRFTPPKPAATDPGRGVTVDLGNRVAASFGEVVEPGETAVDVRPGPMEFAPHRRGNPHVEYYITTTAGYEGNEGIIIEIGYDPAAFADEGKLRIYHMEDGRWVDRTVQVDTERKVVRGEVASLSPFVLALDADEYTLIVNVQGQGGIAVEPDQTRYPDGSTATLTALPDEGWRFSHWLGAVSQPNSPNTTLVMDSDHAITAVFTPVTYILSVDVQGEGETTPEPGTHEYPAGAEVALRAEAFEGWRFDHWLIDGTALPQPETTIIMNANRTIAALFELSEAAAIQIQSFEMLGGNQFRLTWEPAADVTIQFSETLQPGSWRDLEQVQGSGSWTGSAPEPGLGRGFFRIVAP